MKKIIVPVIISMVIFFSGYSQNKITGTSTYFPKDDSICISEAEINYFIANCRLECYKIQYLDDGFLIKRIRIQARDTNSRFLYAYVESNTFYDMNEKNLTCNLVLLDNGEFYEVYELNFVGRKYFERIINETPLIDKCPCE